MRILHVYSGNLYGGVETALATLSRLASLCPDLQQHFALCFEGRLSEELAKSGCPLHLLGAVRASRLFTLRRARQRLRDLLRSANFDAAICHSTWAQALFAPTIQAEKVFQVFWMHEVLHGRQPLELWARLTAPNLTIGNSRFTCDTLPLVYPRTPAEVLYFPVVCSAAPPAAVSRAETRREFGVNEDTIVIIQVSRMEPGKGHHCHLEALNRLRPIPGWVCWMVGGPQRPAEHKYFLGLEARIAKMALGDRVRLLGSRSDVLPLLRAADIYCQPNITPETFGITFIEALSCGLPVVTTAIGGGKEIVSDLCGTLVSPNDPAAVARSLERFILYRELRLAVRSPARKRARELCDPETQMSRLRAILGRTTAAHATV